MKDPCCCLSRAHWIFDRCTQRLASQQMDPNLHMPQMILAAGMWTFKEAVSAILM